MNDTIGSHIRKLRKDRKMTLGDLSESSGVSVPFISEIERGNACPSYNSLQSLAKGLGITVPEIVNVNNVYGHKLITELNELKQVLSIIKKEVDNQFCRYNMKKG